MANGLFGGAVFGNPKIQRQGERARALAQQRNVNTLPDPKTYSAIAGLFGIRPDEMGFSVMHPQYKEIMNVAEPAFYAGTALGIAPMVGFAGKALGPTAQAMRVNAAAPSPFNAATRGQGGATVWHGSPHKFDKFDSSKIGTGEGAQAYGHGGYLADAQDVGKQYRDKLSDILKGASYPGDIAANFLARENGDVAMAVKAMKEASFNLGARDGARIEKAINWIESGKTIPKPTSSGGYLYKVDLPDEQIAKMLDWDKDFNGQPDFVKNALNNAFKNNLTFPTQRELREMVSSPAGKQVVENLRQQGIPGIRYLDGGSRGAGQGSSNYVVFPGNESMLKILERNNQPLDILQDTTKQNIFK